MNYVQLGTLAGVRSGFSFKSKDWKADGVPVIKIANLKDGFITLRGCSFVDENVARDASEFYLDPGDILISMTGYIGEVARVRDEGRMLLNQRVGKFSIKNPTALDSGFLFCCLRDPNLKETFIAHAYGAAQPNISPSLIEQQEIPLPPISIQRRIAKILLAYDDLININQRRIKILEAMARALYREWFVHFRFPGHESATFIESEKGDIPEGWSLKALSSVGTMALGGTPSRKVNAYWGRGDIPWLKSGALNATRVISASEYITKDALASSATKLLPRKAVVVAITGAILVSYLEIEACANQSVIGIYNFDGVGSEYLHLLLEQNIKALENLMTGSAQQHINKEVLGAVKILVPPASVMHSFCDQATPIYEQIRALLFATENLRCTRDLLLPRLLSGELDVEGLAA